MSDQGIGHNAQLKSITDRINHLENEKKDLSEAITEIYAEAKSNGYNPKALRAVIRRQRADARKLAELEADTATYMAALGMLP